MAQQIGTPGDGTSSRWWSLVDLWERIRAAQQSERRERVGWWMGLLLLFVPAFYFLLFFKRYSLLARVGWGLWLGLIVFVKIFGLSDAVVHIQTPHEGQAVAPADPTEVPLKVYLGKLLGAQFMDHYALEEGRILIVYEPHDGYFSDEDVVADLAISNGFSLLYRRDFDEVTLRFPMGRHWREALMTRAAYRDFFGVDEPTMQGYITPERAKLSPVYNVTEEGKRRFLGRFLRERTDLPPAPDPNAPPVKR